MSINEIKKQRESWLSWKNIAPLREQLQKLEDIEVKVSLDDCIKIDSDTLSEIQREKILSLAVDLKPWRKGPFELFDIFIDTEWRSFKKYNLLRPYFNLANKDVADIGCNNGYYMFKMLEDKPKSLVGFDPSAHYKTQFDFINHYIKSDITYEMLGIEHLNIYEKKFDVIFCLGVLYHRSDPVGALKSLKSGLKESGEIFLDTFMIDGDFEYALCPKDRYSKIPNIYFVPTIKALENWCYKAGFDSFEVLEISKTSKDEQRKTEWIEGESLDDFLDPNDENLTIEGYPAPKRVYVKIRRNNGTK